MEKIGLSEQVDWIIGIGMFLLALGFIFVLFRPGITPLHSADTLLDILEDRFFDNVNWELNKVPIFIEPIEYCVVQADGSCTAKTFDSMSLDEKVTVFLGGTLNDPGNPASSGKDKKHIELYEKLKELGNNNLEVFYVISEVDEVLTLDLVSKSEGDITLLPADSNLDNTAQVFRDAREKDVIDNFPKLIDDANSKSVKFILNLVPSKELYLASKLMVRNKIENDPDSEKEGVKSTNVLIYSPYNKEKKSSEIVNLGEFISPAPDKSSVVIACVIEDYYLNGVRTKTAQDSRCQADNLCCKARYEVGATEKLKGLSVVKLNTLKNPIPAKSLDQIKDEWGFQRNRNFRVTISGKGLSEIDFNTVEINKKKGLIFPENAEPPLNVNVFARRFSSFILNDDAELIPVTITLQVW